jgi:hypothetical protein
MKIQNWAMVFSGNDYTAPEVQTQIIQGDVYGNPNFPDGTFIHTSIIIQMDIKRRYVITRSGSKYYLGRMKPEYAKYVREYRKNKKG